MISPGYFVIFPELGNQLWSAMFYKLLLWSKFVKLSLRVAVQVLCSSFSCGNDFDVTFILERVFLDMIWIWLVEVHLLHTTRYFLVLKCWCTFLQGSPTKEHPSPTKEKKKKKKFRMPSFSKNKKNKESKESSIWMWQRHD